MIAYFAFTDECGNYKQIRGERFLQSSPYYVRTTVLLSLDDYVKFQNEMDNIKASFGLQPHIEVKWSHFGSALKNNYNKIQHTLTPQELTKYFSQVLSALKKLKSTKIYYTITDNKAVGRISEVNIIKMHLQNAFQKVQSAMKSCDGFAIVVADDLNDKTVTLKQAIYEMSLKGDYVKYTNIKKGLYVDFSNQCHGLQIADICAGVFTASVKYILSPENEKHKFKQGHGLLLRHLCDEIRCNYEHMPHYKIYKYGVKEIPSGKGCEAAIAISKSIEEHLEKELREIIKQ